MRFVTRIFCLLLLAATLPAYGQRGRSGVQKNGTLSAEQLMQLYRFDEAAQQLRLDIAAARKAQKSTVRLEADLQRALQGADMLLGTERVLFVDSFKVALGEVPATVRLSPGAGRLVDFAALGDSVPGLPAGADGWAYINDLGDRLYFSVPDTALCSRQLYAAGRLASGWTTPEPLPGVECEACSRQSPFVMPDGVTVYFAGQGPGSLGGYDLFVTRYSAESQQYLKAENLGMPFNSPANDLLLAIDETSQLGWLVTDRNQQPDTVCVYVFVPGTTREVYDVDSIGTEQLRQYARLQSMAATQTDQQALELARQRLQEVLAATARNDRQHHVVYVINDQLVYTDLAQFRSASARRIAVQWQQRQQELTAMKARRDELQRRVAQGKRTEAVLDELRQINKALPELKAQCNLLGKNMRMAETKR